MNGFALLFGVIAALAVAPAHARDHEREITPYVEVAQVLTADLQSGDVLTYTSLAAGVDASVRTQRVEVQLSYKYEHRIDWDDRLNDGDVHSGLARAAVKLGRGLTVEGGALATRARNDIRGAATGNLAGDIDNVAQVYSAYAGPTYATRAGPVTINAAYRFGYTKVEEAGFTGVPFGQPALDDYDDATSHMAVVSAGIRAGTILPIGLTLSGAWEREDAGQLDQHYDGKYARIDAVLPVSPTVALTAGAGYERIEISQKDALVDAGGAPVVDGNGRFVTDPSSPRRIAYRTDGLFWDAGVIWRPSRRTTLEARVGRRYDSTTYLGSLSYQLSASSGLQVGVYDSVQSFGRGAAKALANLPTSFNTRNDPFGDQFGGCVFGTTGAKAGNCLTPILGAISTANFRARGVDAVFSANAGAYRWGVGAGYTNRRFFVPDFGPGGVLYGVTDEGYYAQVFAGQTLDRRSSIDVNGYVNYFDSGLGGAPDVFGAGANTNYSYSFGRIGATASVGVYAFEQDGVGSDVSGQALLGMRYAF